MEELSNGRWPLELEGRAGGEAATSQPGLEDLITNKSIGETIVDHDIEHELTDARTSLLHHPVYPALRTLDRLRVFMSNHVFAVWDFMSLLKALQQRLTCVTLPWLPPADPRAARIINEIVLGEESDEIAPGEYLDHFRLYLAAMREVDADARPIERFVDILRGGGDVESALVAGEVPPPTRRFVLSTLAAVRRPTHELAAVFLYGRENLIPQMFTRILEVLEASGLRAVAFRTYLQRHVVLDGEQHGPEAKRLLAQLCGDDPVRWREAVRASHEALESRRALWDGVAATFG
jgi:hypothetical protein